MASNGIPGQQWDKFSVAFFTKEVNLWLAECPLKTNGSLANLELTSLVKEATGDENGKVWAHWVNAMAADAMSNVDIHVFLGSKYQ